MKIRGKKKYIFIVFLAILTLVFYDVINQILFFNMNDSDLKGLDVALIKNKIIANNLSFINLKSRLLFFTSFLLPIAMVIAGYDYSKIRSNYVKYNIGKNNDYFKILRKEKLKSALMIVSGTAIVYLIVTMLALTIGDNKEIYYEELFIKSDILNKIFASDMGYIIFTGLTVVAFSFIFSSFIMFLIDYFKFIRGSLIFMSLIWIGAIVLYRFIPYYYVPMTSLMTTAYFKITLFKVIAPYSLLFIIYMVMRFSMKYEVD